MKSQLRRRKRRRLRPTGSRNNRLSGKSLSLEIARGRVKRRRVLEKRARKIVLRIQTGALRNLVLDRRVLNRRV